jgi:Mg2+/Co2+ transporter CorC
MEQKQKLAAAEQAQGADRDKLMEEHMKMMQETMGKMQAMKPRDGMSPQEQKEWIAEHQKLMDECSKALVRSPSHCFPTARSAS